MSLRGRYMIDRLHKALGHRFRLPCPPYQDPFYWNEGVYKSLGPNDVYEWGDVHFDDLEMHSYRVSNDSRFDNDGNIDERNTTFRETLNLHPCKTTEKHVKKLSDKKERIMLLGCGNSKLGEDMAASKQFRYSELVQVDVSRNLITSMEERCFSHISSGVMQFVEDDATSLSAFGDKSIDAVVDKGLVDAIYCTRIGQTQISQILSSVNRVLIPGGIFVFFSFSRPEYFEQSIDLKSQRTPNRQKSKKEWDKIEVRELNSIFLYNFQKSYSRGRRRNSTS